MKYNQKFVYKKLIKKENNGKRLYESPDGYKLPSVTTILSATKDMKHINEWRNKIGHKKATQITTDSANVGTLLHKHLENYIQGIKRPTGSNHVRQLAEKMADIIIDKALKNVQEVWGLEAPLYYPKLYAGTADVIGIHENQEAIMDFKNTRRPKKREWLEDYFMQMVAYGLAHNEIYGTNIRKGVIFMVAREDECFGEYQEFELSGNEWNNYIDKWCDKIEKYYKLNPTVLNQPI